MVRTQVPIAIASDSAALRSYYAGGNLVYSVERTMLSPGGSLDVSYLLDKNGASIELPPDAKVQVSISSVNAGNQSVPTDRLGNYAYLSSFEAPYTNE